MAPTEEGEMPTGGMILRLREKVRRGFGLDIFPVDF